MRKLIKLFSFFFLFFLIFFLKAEEVKAAIFEFEPQAGNFASGETFTIKIILDGQGEKIVGAEAAVVFDPEALKIKDVKKGSYFPETFLNIGKERLQLGGAVSDLNQEKQGRGEFFTLTLESKKAGETILSFLCQEDAVDESSIFILGGEEGFTDIIDCAKLTLGKYTFSGGQTSPSPTPLPGESNPTLTPTPKANLSPTPTPTNFLSPTPTSSLPQTTPSPAPSPTPTATLIPTPTTYNPPPSPTSQQPITFSPTPKTQLPESGNLGLSLTLLTVGLFLTFFGIIK